jgi:hypothetical protein
MRGDGLRPARDGTIARGHIPHHDTDCHSYYLYESYECIPYYVY